MMESPNSEAGRTSSGRQHQEAARLIAQPLRSRVRTGCLTCKARKVKCGEQRPRCQNCLRLKKSCIYRAPLSRRRASPPSTPAALGSEPADLVEPSPSGSRFQENTPLGFRERNSGLRTGPTSDEDQSDAGSSEAFRVSEDQLSLDLQRVESVCQNSQAGIVEAFYARMQSTSDYVYMVLTKDLSAASEALDRASFSYFLEDLDSPILSTLDGINWQRMKTYVSQVASQEKAVAMAILGVQYVHRAQVNRMPMGHALSMHQVAVTTFESLLGNEAADFQIVLIVAFLLCLTFVTLPNEDSASLSIFNGSFKSRLESWLQTGQHSPISLRLIAWMQLLHTSTKLAGSPGLLPDPVAKLLFSQERDNEVPNLSGLEDNAPPSNYLYDVNSSPVFMFYMKVQKISLQIGSLNHYYRSRITPDDQAEVIYILTDLKENMQSIWQTRPAPLRLNAGEIREHLSETIAEPLISLTGVCHATYCAELVRLGRILADPPPASLEAQEAMKEIRNIIEGGWNAFTGGQVNPGYIRPLFIYAIECLHESETAWAVENLRKIKNPLSRSEFVASLAKSLAAAQRKHGRRVTTKYFCYETFGVPPPFM